MTSAGARVGFVGAGKMAQAISRGLIASGYIAPEAMIASAPPKFGDSYLQDMQKLGVHTTHDNTEVAQKSDIIFIAVKPTIVRKVTAELAPTINKQKLLISIAMGINLNSIESLLPAKARVVRAMPNTPAVVRAGASAYSLGHACLEGDGDTVCNLLSSVGYAVEMPEDLIDAVTGLASSGCSYFFCALEAMADGGVKMGIPRKEAFHLAAHAMMGSAKMVLDLKKHPAELKDDVQSPGGSSIYGYHHLERSAFRGILMDAVESATMRSKETGKQNTSAVNGLGL